MHERMFVNFINIGQLEAPFSITEGLLSTAFILDFPKFEDEGQILKLLAFLNGSESGQYISLFLGSDAIAINLDDTDVGRIQFQ